MVKFLIVEKEDNIEAIEQLQQILANNGLEVKTLLVPENGDSQSLLRNELMSSVYTIIIIGFLAQTCANFYDLAKMVRNDRFCSESKDANIFLFTDASLEDVEADQLFGQYNISGVVSKEHPDVTQLMLS